MFKDKEYKKLFKSIGKNNCMFVCEQNAEFLSSLRDDGYDGYILLTPVDKMIKPNQSEKTSIFKTGFIYSDDMECYYEITVLRLKTDVYNISVHYCPLTFCEDDKGTLYMG